MSDITKHPFESFHYCPRCGGEFNINNDKSSRCEACGFVYYFNPSAATVAVIINDNNELLVCRRAKEPSKGMLDLPGGFCDMFETAEEGVIREVLEETGGRVVHTEFLFSLPNTYLYSGFWVHTIDSFFRCELDSYIGLNAGDDAADCFFMAIDELSEEAFGLNSIKVGVSRLKELFVGASSMSDS